MWWGGGLRRTLKGWKQMLSWQMLCGMGTVITWPSSLTGLPLAHPCPRENSKLVPLLWADAVLDSQGFSPYTLPTDCPWAAHNSHNGMWVSGLETRALLSVDLN